MHSRLQHEMHHAQTQLPSWPDPWQSVPVLKLALKLLSQTIDYLEVVSTPLLLGSCPFQLADKITQLNNDAIGR